VTYDLPPELLGVALKGRYRGQRQWWFAMRFTGKDSDISITAKPGTKAEFDDWAWRSIDELPALVTPFKRGMYETVIGEFRHLAQPVASSA
jgi:putative (di)nucleoside polyphosphate hydrolase